MKYNVHHTGVLVRNLEAGRKQYEMLGFHEEGEPVYDRLRGIDILFMKSETGERVELIESVDPESMVAERLKKNGPGCYHICWSVPDLDVAIAELKALKFIVVSPKLPAPALSDHCVAFLFSRQSGLIELLEEKTNEE